MPFNCEYFQAVQYHQWFVLRSDIRPFENYFFQTSFSIEVARLDWVCLGVL